MRTLELLAPAKDKTVGIAAIDCGADAVYIAGPVLGNRKAAGNSLEDIRELCDYAHLFGARIFLTVNTIIRDDEWEEAHSLMLEAQDAGVDAIIFREEGLLRFGDVKMPMHASTQCAIRDLERARHFESLGCERVILERGLSLEDVRKICAGVRCEVEFFVHGALCVCYSGDCRLSEYLDGRSADRGDCIQACRSLYDLVDESGKVLVRDKALLSMRDFKLLDRRRASFGTVRGGFTPDSDKTFNRGYTQWWLDGKRDKWSSMDAPKAMGELVGEVQGVRPLPGGAVQVQLRPSVRGLALSNGDGFAFVSGSAIRGFRADRCEGLSIICKKVEGLRPGVKLYRNINAAFERELEARSPKREVDVAVDVEISGSFVIKLIAATEDGRRVESCFNADVEKAQNLERSEAMLREQLSKRSGVYHFVVRSVSYGSSMPLLSASTINSMRRLLAQDIDSCRPEPWRVERSVPAAVSERPALPREELMRTRYCVKFELGMCQRYQGAAPSGRLYLVNNGRRLPLGFDCRACEMTVGRED